MTYPPESHLQDVVGGVEFTGRYNDFWAGLTYSHALGDHVGLGLTWYGALRSQSRAGRSTALFAGTDGSGLSAIDDRSLEYSAIRTLSASAATSESARSRVDARSRHPAFTSPAVDSSA